MMIEMNKAVVPGQVCLTGANPNKAAAGSVGGRLQNLVTVVDKGKLGSKIFISSPPQLAAAAAIPISIPVPIPPKRGLMPTSNSNADITNNIRPFILSSSSYRNPCLDLFFNALRSDYWKPHCFKYLKQLLSLAWSHNSLTTLKLIFSIQTLNSPSTKFDTAISSATTPIPC